MNLYALTAGNIRYYVAAEDEQGAYDQGTDPQLFPDLHFRSFAVEQITVEGFTVSLKQSSQEGAETVTGRGRRKAAV